MYLLVNFVDQTFHVIERVRARAPLETYWRPLGRRTPPQLRTTGLADLAKQGSRFQQHVLVRSFKSRCVVSIVTQAPLSLLELLSQSRRLRFLHLLIKFLGLLRSFFLQNKSEKLNLLQKRFWTIFLNAKG